jgi:hypothetical protein
MASKEQGDITLGYLDRRSFIMGDNMTNFQHNLIEKSKPILKDISGQEIEFQEITGKKEFYFKTSLKIGKTLVDIYIYKDEAGYMLNSKDWIMFEKPDYQDENELIQSFINNLESLKINNG